MQKNIPIQKWLKEKLLKVEKPGRYVGGEYNQVVKSWDAVETHIALIFPDIYDLGISNLGLAILYEAINQRQDALAERAYSPWFDMEDLLRLDGVPLFSLETRHPLHDFDILALTLPYETLYTNALNILDLSHVPVFSNERTENHPLVLAGGHATFNPEPMASFIDAFVIGEGEEVIHEIILAHQTWKKQNASRDALLLNLSEISGVYIPKFYQPIYRADGTIVKISIASPRFPDSIQKRIVGKLPPSPQKLLVPSIDVVHNRIAIEIMRGCTRGCRFCHAGMINRPVRERSVEEILSSIQTALENTGFEEIALLSLSSSDYTHIDKLISEIGVRFSHQKLRISLPSLRIETFSIDLMELLKDSKSAGFTLAPEAATDRMRNIINKPITQDQLLETAREVYRRGWPTLKLYFMIGHPSETLDDVQAIADVCNKVLDIGFKILGRRAKLNVGVGTFVPKPHTPFQWVSCDTEENIHAKQQLLFKEMKRPGLKLNWTDSAETLLEAVLTRGDRKIGSVIYTAWTLGAKFDAWQDRTKFDVWEEAFARQEIDRSFYTHRVRSMNEVFPWDHINIGVKKSYLRREYENSLTGKVAMDCRSKCYSCGILTAFSEVRENNPGELWMCPEIVQRIE